MTLNRRHKAGLLLALTATGLSLFFELSVKQTAGIAVLGIAVAWFAGSIGIRALGLISAVVIAIFGLYVATAPLGHDWVSVKESATDYDLAIQALSTAVRNTPSYEIEPPKRVDYDALAKQFGAISSTPATAPLPPGFVLDRNVVVPEAVEKWIQPASKPSSGFFDSGGRPVIDFPGKMSDEEIMAAFQKILLPKPRFTFGAAIKAHVPRMFGGILLFVAGLAACAWQIRRGRAQVPEV